MIDEWAQPLSEGDVDGAAAYFAIPSVAQNGPALLRIRDLADAKLFNASLPCGASLVEATPEGGFVDRHLPAHRAARARCLRRRDRRDGADRVRDRGRQDHRVAAAWLRR